MKKLQIVLIKFYILSILFSLSLNAEPSVLLNEKFDNNANEWTVGDFDNYNTKIENGKMTFLHKFDKQTSTIWLSTNLDGDKPYTIETTFRQTSGLEDNGHGVIWGVKDSKNYYSFCISDNGFYRIGKKEDNKWYEYYNGWSKSSWIKTSGNSNKLKIVRDGDVLKLYINDYFQNEIEAPTLYGGGVGFLMSHKHTLDIDYLSVIGEITDEPIMLSVKEQFDNNDNEWLIKNDDSIVMNIADGKLNIQNKTKDNGYYTWKNFKLSENKPFTIETTIKHQNSQSVFAFGLVWGISDAANLYTFNISNYGYYRICRTKENNWHEYVAWTKSEHIKTNNGSNKLSIKKIDNKLKFYINDNYVNQIDFENFFDTGFGFAVWNKQTIEVDNLFITGRETHSTFDDIMDWFD